MILIGPASESRPNMKGFGFFSSAVYDDETGLFLGCVEYSNYLRGETDDTAFKLARIFGASLGAAITLATFVCLLVQCFNKHGKSCLWVCMKWSYVVAFLCQGSSFVMWTTDLCKEYEGQDAKCYVGSNGVTAMFNGALLFGMVIATFNSSPPRNPVFRCWYATLDESETDESVVDEGMADIESQETHKSQTTQKSQKSHKTRSTKRTTTDEVSLFGSSRSIRTWRSNGPRLTVKELTRRLERKNIWPMNQMQRGVPSAAPNNENKVHRPAAVHEEFEDPRVRTYYRTQAKIFKKFDQDKSVKKPKSNDTVQTSHANSNDESTIESLKDNEEVCGQQCATSRPAVMSSPFFTHSRTAKEEGVETPIAETFLRQIRMRQEQNMAPNEVFNLNDNKEETPSVKSGSAKSGSAKSGSAKSGSAKSGSAKSGSTKSGSVKSGKSFLSGSVKSGSQKSSGTKKSVMSSKSSTTGLNSIHENKSLDSVLEQLRSSVVLGKGGVRIDETRIGNTLKIVDEYAPPADGDRSKSKGKSDGTQAVKSSKATGSQIVKVRTEFCPEGRKTIMEETRADGSCLVTTLIDPFTIDVDMGP